MDRLIGADRCIGNTCKGTGNHHVPPRYRQLVAGGSSTSKQINKTIIKSRSSKWGCGFSFEGKDCIFLKYRERGYSR